MTTPLLTYEFHLCSHLFLSFFLSAYILFAIFVYDYIPSHVCHSFFISLYTNGCIFSICLYSTKSCIAFSSCISLQTNAYVFLSILMYDYIRSHVWDSFCTYIYIVINLYLWLHSHVCHFNHIYCHLFLSICMYDFILIYSFLYVCIII